MAWPVVQDFFAAQIAFQGASGLPEDQYTNTWYFRNRQEPSITPVGPRIESVLAAFYTDDFGSGDRSVVSFMHSGDLAATRLAVYDLGQGPPRNPDYDVTLDWSGNSGGGTRIPGEVALVLSYYAGRQELEPPINVPRRRGRLYLGPFRDPAVSGSSRPSPDLRSAIAGAALNVRDTTEDVEWHQLSSTNGTLHPVTGGWVDDAWDTQRSRGLSPSSRDTWGDPLAT